MSSSSAAIHCSPSRQGVHQPHDSWAKNCIMLSVMPTGQVWSSSSTSVPVPRRLWTSPIVEKPSGTSIWSAGTSAVEAPPGLTARSAYPGSMPPACTSMSSRIGTPIGSSKQPGLATRPATPKILVPPSSVTDRAFHQSTPCRTIAGTAM